MDGLSNSMRAVSLMLGRLVAKFIAGAIADSLKNRETKKRKIADDRMSE